MKAVFLSLCLVYCLLSHGQSPDALKYAPRPILLLSGDGVEELMPMVFTVNGQQHLEFVPAPGSRILWRKADNRFVWETCSPLWLMLRRP